MNKRPFITKLFSILLNLLTCLIAAAIILYRQDWFGKGDTRAFMFWTVPLALGLAVSGETLLNLFRTLGFGLRLLIIIAAAGLLSFAWAYSVVLMLGVWSGAFSFSILPLWMAGCTVQLLFLDWRLPQPTDKIKGSKVLLGFLSFPAALMVGVFAMYFLWQAGSYMTRPERETFLFPENFRGAVYVVYGQKNGEPKAYEKNRRLYQIPDNGILFTQFKAEYGRTDQDYFFVDRAGKRTPFVQKEAWISSKNKDETPKDSTVVFILDTGHMADSSMADSIGFHYTKFFVGAYHQTQPLPSDRLSFEKVDSLRNAYLKNKR
ncbi:MAG: hypothetical protein H6573_26840 [Lewinellaceae bacterium]|nr:hypothetical protein [Lewinellaceae bacterium]